MGCCLCGPTKTYAHAGFGSERAGAIRISREGLAAECSEQLGDRIALLDQLPHLLPSAAQRIQQGQPLQCRTIGARAIVGAGAVVTKDVKSFALVTGVPARQVGWMCRCGETLPGIGNRESGIECSACNTKYELHDDTLRLAEAP